MVTASSEILVTESPSSDKTSFYLPELDILRFFAFFLVFIHHAFYFPPEWFQDKLHVSPNVAAWIYSITVGGGFGVDLFFALSSYLITELLIREYEKHGKINIWAFYVRRGLRIYPLYYTFILLTIFVFSYIFNDSLPYPFNIGFLVFAANWVCAVYNFPTSVATPLWSVSIEEQFYFLCPILISLVKPKRLKHLAIAMILIALMTRFLLVALNAPSYSTWFVSFARLDPIAGGILLAIFLRSGFIRRIDDWKNRFLLCLAALVLSLVVIRYFGFEGEKVVLGYFLIAVSCFFIILSFMHPRGITTKRYAILIYLGRISYGLYVFHILALVLAQNAAVYFHATGIIYILMQFVGGFIITVILAVLSYHSLEQPFLKLKKKFTYV